MQSDHTTIFEIGEQADDLMTEMGAAGFHGMSDAQADIVVRMGRLLDRAARAISGLENTKTGQLINRAANHALAMRMHGSTMRGVTGAELLEDLCDAVIGIQLEATAAATAAKAAKTKEDDDRMTVEKAMEMLGCRTFAEFFRTMDCSETTVKNWRSRGRLPDQWVERVRVLYRGMQVRTRAAA